MQRRESYTRPPSAREVVSDFTELGLESTLREFSQTTLAKIERGRRAVAFVEVQSLAELYGTDVETLEKQQKAYLAAMAHTVTSKLKPWRSR